MEVCDHCGAPMKKAKYTFFINTPMKFKSYSLCSEECFKSILHKEGVATYPAINKSSLKCSKIAIVLSIVAIVIQIIRIIVVML